jgi:hypothetical protein
MIHGLLLSSWIGACIKGAQREYINQNTWSEASHEGDLKFSETD